MKEVPTMHEGKSSEREKKDEEALKLERKDLIAIIIAQFQVLLLPVAILLGAFALVLVLLMLFWVRT
jgi:hypothetical protein